MCWFQYRLYTYHIDVFGTYECQNCSVCIFCFTMQDCGGFPCFFNSDFPYYLMSLIPIFWTLYHKMQRSAQLVSVLSLLTHAILLVFSCWYRICSLSVFLFQAPVFLMSMAFCPIEVNNTLFILLYCCTLTIGQRFLEYIILPFYCRHCAS